MGTLYLSSAVAPDKRHFWERTIDETFGAVDMKIVDNGNYFGEMRRSTLGNLELSQVVCDNEFATRTPRHIAQDQVETFILVLLRAGGRLQIRQLDRECVLSPGTFALFDLNAPYTFRHDERTHVLGVQIPLSSLRSRLRDPRRFVVRGYAAEVAAGRITADFLTSVARELDHIPEATAHRYCGEFVDLVGILLESEDDDLPIASSAVRSAVYRRCVGIIDGHLTDPLLSPEKIAKAAGISVRYLHKIFQEAGESVSAHVRHRRLARARCELSDTAKRNLPISEIAFRLGFHSQSHFNNCFKRQYGVSPGEFRLLSCGDV